MDEGIPMQPPPPPPPDILDPEDVARRNRRRKIIIIVGSVFGGLAVLGVIAIGIIYAIGQSISAVCQNMCSGCTCDCGCDEACSNSCSNACNCGNCSDSASIVQSVDEPKADVEAYVKYLWEFIKEWFYNLFS